MLQEEGGLRTRNRKKEWAEGKPVISVITIVYNGEKNIERAIRSVLDQTYTNIEYLVIDGMSKDRTLDIVRRYEEYIDYWISEPDNGIYDAFNKGFSLSTGNYIAYLNSDDWYQKDVIKSVAEKITDNRKIYCGNLNLIEKESGSLIKVHNSRPDRIFQTMRIAHPSSFVPREVFAAVGGFSEKYRIAMDYDFMLKAKIAGYEFVLIDRVIANHLTGGNSSNLLRVHTDELKVKNDNLGYKFGHFTWYLANFVLYFMNYIFKRNRQ